MHDRDTGNETISFTRKIRCLQKCANANFSNFSIEPKTWMIFAVMAVFAMWNLSGVLEYSSEIGIRCTPWIYPHFFSMPTMWLVYGFLTISLFSDAPFHSSFSNFMQIRMGKRTWLFGQCLFIFEASLCYSITYFLLSIIIILPRIIVINKWGKLIETFAYNREAAEHLTGIYFMASILEKYSPLEATLLMILIVWLVSCFLGMLILACRILFGGNAGNGAAGFLVFLSYFCVYIGSMVFGNTIYKFSPVSWINIAAFQWKNGYPDLTYSISFLLLGILAFIVLGSIFYEKRDMVQGG